MAPPAIQARAARRRNTGAAFALGADRLAVSPLFSAKPANSSGLYSRVRATVHMTAPNNTAAPI